VDFRFKILAFKIRNRNPKLIIIDSADVHIEMNLHEVKDNLAEHNFSTFAGIYSKSVFESSIFILQSAIVDPPL
jgi:hypothetical protein